jgi:hypothetical protein
MVAERKISESFAAYESGKHRRYNLLFSVNGGAFAVAKLFYDPKLLCDGKTAPVLGGLSLGLLSFGMIIFSIVMTLDIFMFGEKMRAVYLPGAFKWQGKMVLFLICLLLCMGWFLVARPAAL